MNVMVIVPHPDDEVLAFGGVIQKHVKEGDNVFVLFMTEVRIRRLEIQREQFPSVGEKLGYKGEFYETELDDDHFDMNVSMVEEYLEEFKPDILYTVFGGDNHQDHEYMFKVIRIAARVWGPFLVKKIVLGEILSSTDQAPKLPQNVFLPTLYVPLTKDQVLKKIECMKMYEEEIQKWPHPRSAKGVMNLAERRGSECHSLYAESFMVLRDIKDL